MALAEMSLQADWTYYGYLKSFSGYQSEFDKNKDAIEAGIKVYNEERSEAEKDTSAEAAFLQERTDAEAFLSLSPKNYQGMRQRVGTWAKLLPAINSFAAAQRAFRNREPTADEAAETKAKLEFDKIIVALPGSAGTFAACEQKITKLAQGLDGRSRQRANDKLGGIPDAYKKTDVIARLILDTTSGEQQNQVKAHKQILAWSEALAGFAEAKKVLDEFAGGKNTHPTANAVLTPLVSPLPGPMTSPQGEQDLIAQATQFKQALADGQAYTDARKKAEEAWAKSKPKPAEAAYADATGPFKTVDEMKHKIGLLELVTSRITEALHYAAALEQLGKEAAKIETLEPEASSAEGRKFATDLKQARDGAAVLANGGNFVEAKQQIGQAQLLVQKRSREVRDERRRVVDQAKAGFDKNDPQLAPEALAVLGKLHGAAPKAGADALLDSGHPHLKLAAMDALARRYSRVLADAKANWAAAAPTPLTPTYTAATTLTVPAKADDIVPGLFDEPTKRLTAFNKLWQNAKDFTAQAALVQESFETLDALYKASKQSGNARAFIGPVTEARKQLAKLRQETMARKYDLAGLTKLSGDIDQLLVQFAGEARDSANKLVANDPANKALIAAIDTVVDKSGNDAVASLYMAFGDKLPGLLRGLSTGSGEAGAAAGLKTLVERLGARGLRQLATATSGDDTVAAGKLLISVRDTGLAGAGADPSQSFDAMVAAFPDQADLGGLLNHLAAGDPAKAGQRLAQVLSTYLGQDIRKLKTPFYDNLKKLSVDALPGMLVQAERFKQKAATRDDLDIDPSTTKDLDCPPERVKHFLNRHTYDYCGFKEENFQNAATFWPNATTAQDIQAYLAAAIKAIDPVPDADTMTSSFIQRDVTITAAAGTIAVRVGFQRYMDKEEYKVKITQFYPRSGKGLRELSTREMKFIGRGLFGK